MVSAPEPTHEPITMVHSLPLNDGAVVGGIETWIGDLLDFRGLEYRVLGVSVGEEPASGSPRFDSTVASFVIANIPRQRKFLPHAIRLALGLIKNRRLLTDRIVVHRIELVPILRLLHREARIILIIHTNLEAQLREGSDSLWRFLRIPYLVLETFALKLADVVISHSSADAPRLKKKKPDMEVMPGWYSDRHFGLTSPPPSRGGMIWVGRFEKVKDPLLAVQAFAALPEGHGSTLSLVGSGSMRAEIEEEAETLGVRQALILQDPLDPADLCQLMQQHRILLHTSHFEGSPRVLLEALASGLVVVTLPECDPDRWVEKTGAGIYAESRSPEDIARAIESAPPLEPREISKYIEFRAGSRIIPHLENLFLRRP